MKNKLVTVPSIRTPIMPAPGFQKKGLADHKLDLMALCGFGCSYCSSNDGNYLRINREKFADATEEQLGERLLPATSPELAMLWPDVIEKLEAQIKPRRTYMGRGKTLVFSMLTDGFSPVLVGNGTTEAALRLVLEHTHFRIRVLTKNAVVGSLRWVDFFREHPGRFVVGLSCGTMNERWAERVEKGTSSPGARLNALRTLQDAGVPTYGMLCPIFPDVLEGVGLHDLVSKIRPDRCETVWAEPYNDRANWASVRAGYDPKSQGARWLTDTYELHVPGMWSSYATDLYQRLRVVLASYGSADKLRYLLYEDQIRPEHAPRLAGLDGVLLQSKPHPELARDGLAHGADAALAALTGYSQNPCIAALQTGGPQHGRVPS